MILGSNGIKMGKRFPEFVVNPSDIIEKYGADTLRLYEMFMGPLEASKPWNDQAVEGARRFLNKVWMFFTESDNICELDPNSAEGKELKKLYHKTVKKVTNDFEALAFNTAISQMMIFMNAATKIGKCNREYAEGFVKMISCVCPHIGEEIWSQLGHDNTIAYEKWPEYDEEATKDDEIEIAVQVNGKVKGKLMVAADEDEASVKAKGEALDNVAAAMAGKTVVKEIYIKGRILNIVVK
jgi:leucyl-tRNA synthetase